MPASFLTSTAMFGPVNGSTNIPGSARDFNAQLPALVRNNFCIAIQCRIDQLNSYGTAGIEFLWSNNGNGGAFSSGGGDYYIGFTSANYSPNVADRAKFIWRVRNNGQDITTPSPAAGYYISTAGIDQGGVYWLFLQWNAANVGSEIEFWVVPANTTATSPDSTNAQNPSFTSLTLTQGEFGRCFRGQLGTFFYCQQYLTAANLTAIAAGTDPDTIVTSGNREQFFTFSNTATIASAWGSATNATQGVSSNKVSYSAGPTTNITIGTADPGIQVGDTLTQIGGSAAYNSGTTIATISGTTATLNQNTKNASGTNVVTIFTASGNTNWANQQTGSGLQPLASPATGQIFLTELRPNKAFSTIGTGNAMPTFKGTYNNYGSPPTAMDYQLLNASTLAIITSWTALTSFSAATGAWSGQASIGPGGPYLVQFRDHNTTTITYNSANQFWVSKCNVVIGQSPYGFLDISNQAWTTQSTFNPAQPIIQTPNPSIYTTSTASWTGTTTSITLSGANIAVSPGMVVTGPGLLLGTTVVSISGTALVINQNTAGTETSVTITFQTPVNYEPSQRQGIWDTADGSVSMASQWWGDTNTPALFLTVAIVGTGIADWIGRQTIPFTGTPTFILNEIANIYSGGTLMGTCTIEAQTTNSVQTVLTSIQICPGWVITGNSSAYSITAGAISTAYSGLNGTQINTTYIGMRNAITSLDPQGDLYFQWNQGTTDEGSLSTYAAALTILFNRLVSDFTTNLGMAIKFIVNAYVRTDGAYEQMHAIQVNWVEAQTDPRIMLGPNQQDWEVRTDIFPQNLTTAGQATNAIVFNSVPVYDAGDCVNYIEIISGTNVGFKTGYCTLNLALVNGQSSCSLPSLATAGSNYDIAFNLQGVTLHATGTGIQANTTAVVSGTTINFSKTFNTTGTEAITLAGFALSNPPTVTLDALATQLAVPCDSTSVAQGGGQSGHPNVRGAVRGGAKIARFGAWLAGYSVQNPNSFFFKRFWVPAGGNGSVIYADLSHAMSTAQLQTVNGGITASTIYGFEISNNSFTSTLTYTAAIIAPNRIAITLTGGAPSNFSQLQVQYLILGGQPAATPYYVRNQGDMLYDNTNINGIGMPVQATNYNASQVPFPVVYNYAASA